MSLSSAETSSCSRWGAWASRLRCLWTVQRWVGTSPHRAASACSSPVPPQLSPGDNQELRLAPLALDAIVEDGPPCLAGLATHIVDRPQHLLAVLTHPEHDQQRDRGGLAVEPDPHHRSVEDQADDRFLGERAGIPASQSAFTFRHSRL